jgi:hypothetical protein
MWRLVILWLLLVLPPLAGAQPGLEGFGLPASQQIDSDAFIGSINQGCTSFKIVGSCASQVCPDCQVVDYYQPIYAVSVVKIPGDRLLGDGVFGDFMAPGAIPSVLSFFDTGRLIGGGGADNSMHDGKTSMHFNEVRVYSLPPQENAVCGLCSSPQAFMVLHYSSDPDELWRLAEENAIEIPDLPGLVGLGPLGVWQPLTPLGGHAVHGSPVVAAAIAAARGVWVTSVPQIPPRPVILPGEPASCFQPAWPLKYPCFPVGMPPTVWDIGHVSLQGKFLYIFWTRRTCCLPAENAACGLATSGQGQNFCDLPLLGPAAGAAAAIGTAAGN